MTDAACGAEAVELRLAAGRGPCEGRVEVKLRGRWGTVADATWTMEDAEVVCQQLGCGSAAGVYHGSKFGPAEGPINLAVVNCRGNECVLWDCAIQGWGPYDDHHDHDTAVVCQGKGAGGRPRREPGLRCGAGPARARPLRSCAGAALERHLRVRRLRAPVGLLRSAAGPQAPLHRPRRRRLLP